MGWKGHPRHAHSHTPPMVPGLCLEGFLPAPIGGHLRDAWGSDRQDGPPCSGWLKAWGARGTLCRGGHSAGTSCLTPTAGPPPQTPRGVGPAAEPQFRGTDLHWLCAVSSGPASPRLQGRRPPRHGGYGRIPCGPHSSTRRWLGLVRSLKAALPTLSLWISRQRSGRSCPIPATCLCSTLEGRPPQARASPCPQP